MPLTFHHYQNIHTGKVWRVPVGRYGNFLSSVKKLVNYIRYNIPRYYCAHVTLTVAENVPDINCDHVHRVLQFIGQRLKRAGSDFKYIAVKELQERGAIHFHILCVYSKPYIFPSSGEIASSWGLGFVKIAAPKLRLKPYSVANYIGKYIGKGYEYEQLDVRKSFTTSQVKQIYKLRPDRLAAVMSQFGKDRAEKFKCTYRKVFEHTFIRKLEYSVNDWFLEAIEKTVCVKKEMVMEFPSEWAYCGVTSQPR